MKKQKKSKKKLSRSFSSLHSSLDSKTLFSDVLQHKDSDSSDCKGNDIILFKTRAEIIKKIALFFSTCLFIFAVLYPWFRTRAQARDSVDTLLLQYIANYSNSIIALVEKTLDYYEVGSDFMVSINDRVHGIKCEKQNFAYFVNYMLTLESVFDMPPTHGFIYQAKGSRNFCQLDFNSTNRTKFTLFFYTPFNSTHNALLLYNETIDYYNWDPNYYDGKTIYLPNDTINFSGLERVNYNMTYWSDHYKAFGRDSRTVAQLTANTPFFEGDDLIAIGGISLTLEQLYQDLASKLTQRNFSEFALLSKSNGTLIMSGKGIIAPIGSTLDQPIYPKLNELNDSMWNLLYPYVQIMSDREVKYIDFEDNHYVLTIQSITPRGKSITHYLVVVIRVADYMEHHLYKVSLVLVVFVVFSCLGTVLTNYLLRKNNKIRIRRLGKNVPLSSTDQTFLPSIDDDGILTESIKSIRLLELTFPEDLTLNKMLDNVVNNLAEQKFRHSLVIDDHQCNYCQYLVKKKKLIHASYNTNTYETWKNTTLRYFKMDIKKVFNVDEYEAKPVQMLMKLIVSIISECDLLFNQIDPDLLILFFSNFARNCINDPVHTALKLHMLYWLITNNFKMWINQKIDVFILFFTAFVEGVNYKYAIEQIAANDNADEEQLEEIIRKINQDEVIFQDGYSKCNRKVKLIFDIFNQFVPSNYEDPVYNYFVDSVTNILFAIQPYKHFDLIGEIRNRICSSEFNIQTDVGDLTLFMESILKVSIYSCYFSPEEVMIKLINRKFSSVFTKEEVSDPVFMANFHYEFATKIVVPLINILINFNPMKEIYQNVQRNINYWHYIIQENGNEDS